MNKTRTVSARRRREMIAEAAYFRAEKRGFDGGDSLSDWIAAEAEVDALLRTTPPAPAAPAARATAKAEAGAKLLHVELAERLEEAADDATRRLSALRRKLTRLSGGARAEWERDVERLTELRTRVRASLKELRSQGEHAGREAQRRAETARAEVATVLERVARKLRG